MDAEQIANILSDTSRQEVQYADAQWLYVNDYNNQNYSTFLQFITTTLKTQFIDYHNAYVFMPLALEFLNLLAWTAPTTVNGTSGTGAVNSFQPLAAMRQSVLSLIGQMNVTTDQGQTFVNDQHTELINNLRLEVEHNLEWIYTQGEVLDCAYDAPCTPDGSPLFSNLQTGSATQTLPGATTGPTSTLNGPAYKAFQGLQPFATTPAYQVVNDPNEFAGTTYGAAFPIVVSGTGGVISTIGGVAVTASATISFYVTAQNGEVGKFTFATNSTSNIIAFQSTAGVTTTTGTTASNWIPATLQSSGLFVVQSTLDDSGTNFVLVPMFLTVQTNGTYFSVIGGFSLGTASTSGNGLVNTTLMTGGRNPNFNNGFARRIAILQNTSGYSYTPAGTLSPIGQQVNSYGCHT
jgi:hypothetical protein